MAFWGVSLKPGASKGVDSPQGDIMHLSQACLHEPKEGKNYVVAKVQGTSYAIACLEKGKKEHDCFDLFFSSGDCVFVNKGQSEVHLTGYFEPDGMDDDEESESEEKPPVTNASPKVVAGSPKAVVAGSPKAVASTKAAAAQEDDDEDDDFEDEESEEEEAAPPTKGASPKQSPKAAAAKAAAADDDSDDEEFDEDEESEEEPPSKASPAKRAAPAPVVGGSPAKKAKAEPASAGQEAWVKQLHEYLKKNGKSNFSTLGTKVPRPAEVPKMKLRALFEQHTSKFTVSGENVEAK